MVRLCADSSLGFLTRQWVVYWWDYNKLTQEDHNLNIHTCGPIPNVSTAPTASIWARSLRFSGREYPSMQITGGEATTAVIDTINSRRKTTIVNNYGILISLPPRQPATKSTNQSFWRCWIPLTHIFVFIFLVLISQQQWELAAVNWPRRIWRSSKDSRLVSNLRFSCYVSYMETYFLIFFSPQEANRGVVCVNLLSRSFLCSNSNVMYYT